jgi:hypothetical protein
MLDFEKFTKVETKQELIDSFHEISYLLEKLYSSIPVDKFFKTPADGSWSVSKNIDHLYKANLAVILGLKTPKPLLLPFGINQNASRPILKIKELYLHKLKNGAGATLFTPFAIFEDVSDAKRLSSIKKFVKSISNLGKELESWSDDELNKYRVPHPILGILTVREMLFFTVYHLFHHSSKVEEKLKQL